MLNKVSERLDCASHPETDENGFKIGRRCDQCEFMESWTCLVDSVNKIASDDMILDYNEIKAEALRNFIFIEDSMKRNKRKNGTKWAKAINVSLTSQTQKINNIVQFDWIHFAEICRFLGYTLMNDELSIKHLQKNKKEIERCERGITLQQLLRAWSNILKEVLMDTRSNRFATAADVSCRLDQLKKKINLTSLSKGGRAYYEGLNLLMNQSPISIDIRWGRAEDFRHVENHVHLRIVYNPLQSPVIKDQLNRYQTDSKEIKFTDATIEEYDGNKRIRSYLDNHYGVIMSSAREAEDANNEWYENLWYDSKKIFKFCIKKEKDDLYESHFGKHCDMVSVTTFSIKYLIIIFSTI